MKNKSKATSLQILICAVCLGLSICSTAGAAEYYVSTASGSNNNPGTSALPFGTIQKCANTAQAGDTCNIESGTYREQVTLANSGTSSAPITFTGVPGQTATISGADLITGWTQYSGNIYVVNTGFSTPPTQLYVDGQFYDIAHYPTSGYLTATANSSGTESIIDSNLTLTSAQVVGATVITRAVPWALTTNTATAYANGTITLNGNVYYTQPMTTKYGFYLQNMLWMLNAPGEWFYDASAGNLYLWTANSDNPNNHTVEVSDRSYGIYGNSKNFVTIQNLGIANANQYDVYMNVGNNVTLNGLNISGGQIGIETNGITGSTVENNSVQNTLSDGIYAISSNNVNFLNNVINNAGNVGVPKNSVGGLVVNGSGTSNVTINSNTITNSGYAGIWFMGNLMTVENNTIDKSCLVIDDCGGIYTYTNSNVGWTSTISGNTVTNSIGNFSGTAYTFSQAQGIYLDDLSNGYTVTNNKVSNAQFGIYVHTGYNNTITNNNVYDARAYGFQISESGGLTGEVAGAVHNNIVTGNTFETIANSSLNSNLGSGTMNFYSSFGSPVTNFGTFNNNQYCHPNISYAVGTDVNPGYVMTNYTLSNWQKATGQDLNSTDTNASCDPQVSLTITEPVVGGTITSSPSGVNCSSSTCTNSFNFGTDVTLTATASSGSVFTGWSGACTGTSTCSVAMNAAQSVTANFTTQYNLTASTSGNGFGEIFGNGINCGVDATTCSQSLTSGTAVTLTATPASDSLFSGWSGACSGTGNCVVTMSSNTNVTANFTFQTDTVTASAGAGGTISPSGSTTVSYGANQTFTVTPNAGYTPSLTVDGEAVALNNNTYTLNDVTAAHSVAATFTQNTYVITASADSNATISPTSAAVLYGGSQTFTVTPNTGYTASLTVDGTPVTLTGNSYTLSNVTAAHTLAETSTQNTYAITASAASNGSISPTSATVAYGGSQVFTITPNAGYTPQLTVDGTVVALTNNTYTLSDVTATHTLAASFTLQAETINASAGVGGTITPSGSVNVNYGSSQTFTVTPNTGYTSSLSVDGVPVTLTGNSYTLSNVTAAHTLVVTSTLNTYAITASADSNGSISPTSATVAYGASQTFTVTANTGYTASLTVDGMPVTLTGNSYTLNNVTAAHTLAETSTLNTYAITASAGSNGGISPATAMVSYGASQVFTVTPNIGYTASLTVDGTPVALTNNTYTLSNVTAVHSIAATFTLQTETINASAGVGGTITPSGSVNVNYGSSQTFTVTPNTGYTSSLSVDGVPVTLTGNSYTLSNVTAAHTLVVTSTLNTYAITASADSNGSISPTSATVAYGASQTFTVTANTGYTASLTVDGMPVTLTGNSYTLNNVTAAHTLAETSTLNTYAITASAGSNGSISPTSATVAYGASQTFTVTANTGYTASLTVDGMPVTLTGNSYTLNNVTAAHTLAETSTLNTYAITASAGSNGGISPATAMVSYGASQVFTVTPNIGYTASLTVDGTPVTLINNTYTLNNVTTTHTVVANFTSIEYVLGASTTGSGSGVVNGDSLNCGHGGTVCSVEVPFSWVITLHATPAYGSVFTGWSGACSGTGTCTVTMNSAKNVTANFTNVTYALSASTTGTGSGVVNGDSLNCGHGGTVCSVNVPSGYIIGPITATPAYGSVFTGWSGACSGTGTCTVTMSTAKEVIANFSPSTKA